MVAESGLHRPAA